VKGSSSPKGDVVAAAGNTASDRPLVAGRGGGGPPASRVEVMATVILTLAAVATAWSAYQASRWHGEQAVAFSHANAARVESTRASDLADTQREIDVATFSQWVDAYARHETQLADFYRKRFRAEFQPAVAAWIATHPLTNANAPLTPFAMPNYRLAATARADQLERAAEAAAAEAARDIDHANDYVLGGGAVLGRAVLRRHQHPPAPLPPAGGRPRRRVCGADRRPGLGRDFAGQQLS
jgi:hypothetical protein